MESKQPISVIDDVPGGTSEKYRHTFESAGTIEKVRARFYPSQELDLRVEIEYLPDDGNGTPVSLIDHLGKEFLAGDDDEYEFPVRQDYQKGDELLIKVDNNEPDWPYDANIQVEYDPEGGPLSRLSSALTEVFA